MTNNSGGGYTLNPLAAATAVSGIASPPLLVIVHPILECVRLEYETTYEVDFIQVRGGLGIHNTKLGKQSAAAATGTESAVVAALSAKELASMQKQFEANPHSQRRSKISLSDWKKKNKGEHQASLTTLTRLLKIVQAMTQPTTFSSTSATSLSPGKVPVTGGSQAAAAGGGVYMARENSKPSDLFFDFNVHTVEISINKFHFEVLKNNFGIKILHLKIDNLIAKKLTKLNNSLLALKVRACVGGLVIGRGGMH